MTKNVTMNKYLVADLNSSADTALNGCLSSKSWSSIREAVSHLTRLDDFNVIKLSQGFFSQVFKVTHRSTRKVMVLKMNKQAGNRGNALKEIELLNKLKHPNIVGFMGAVVHEGALHPLLEYINCGTLERLIRAYYHLDTLNGEYHLVPKDVHQVIQKNPDAIFTKLGCDIARGMQYLHSRQYIHRDLASKNVFIRKTISESDEKGDAEITAVIGDFGFASLEPAADRKLPTVGSPYCMAPECIKGLWYNHKCDVFSFGVICCELNWRLLSDPDYLPRNDHFLIMFDNLPEPQESSLAKIAKLCCQGNPSVRPEFTEIVEVFELGNPELFRVNNNNNNVLNGKDS